MLLLPVLASLLSIAYRTDDASVGHCSIGKVSHLLDSNERLVTTSHHHRLLATPHLHNGKLWLGRLTCIPEVSCFGIES